MSGKSQIRVFIGIWMLVNLLQAFFTPLEKDEAYYWMWSQQLDFGYFDHPPMIALWVAAGFQLFQNELGLRLIVVLMNALGLWLLWKMLTPKTLYQIRLFMVLTGSCLIMQIFGFIATPDAPLLFFTIAYLFVFQRFVANDSLLNTVLLALVMAGLLYSKYHGLLVILFTILPVWKVFWKNPKFYLAVLVSLLLYIPHFIWLLEHDFAPVVYHLSGRNVAVGFEPERLPLVVVFFFLGTAPLLTGYVYKCVFRFKSKAIFHRSLWWLAVLTGIFFLLTAFKTKVQYQWLLIAYVAILILIYYQFSEQENRNLLKWGGVSVALVIVARIIFAIPEISPLKFTRQFGMETAKFKIDNAVFENYQEASVFKFYNRNAEVAVHRTLGNRESQFTIWDSEEKFFGKNVAYISRWVKAEQSFKGFRNKEYRIKSIENYLVFQHIHIESVREVFAAPDEEIQMRIYIQNANNHPVEIGGDADLALTINYYRKVHYEMDYSQGIKTEKIRLEPGAIKEINVQFKNIPEKGRFHANFGIQYRPIGTTYVSEVMLINSF